MVDLSTDKPAYYLTLLAQSSNESMKKSLKIFFDKRNAPESLEAITVADKSLCVSQCTVGNDKLKVINRITVQTVDVDIQGVYQIDQA